MSKGKITVLGINGHIGQAVAKAFVAAGWDVAGMGRSDKHHTPGVRFIRGDSDSVAQMRAAIGDADVVMNALNMRYDLWFEGRMEGQMARVVEAMGTTGKAMLFPGNIYNFARTNRIMRPDTPQQPETVRGELRVRVEKSLEAAANRGDIQVIILRAGEFYGPDSTDDWFDLAMMTDLKKGIVHTMGYGDVPHAWAYLPDLARAFEALASVRSTLNGFDRFHFSGNFVTAAQMGRAISQAAPVPVKVRPFLMPLLIAGGWFSPILREIARMRYIWKNPLELRDERLEEILGEGFNTPFDQAVAATVMPFFETTRGTSDAGQRLATA